MTILESLAHRLRSGQDVSDGEVERLCRLAKTHEDTYLEGVGAKKEIIGWRDVFLGRKTEGDAGQHETTNFEQGEDLDSLYYASAIVLIILLAHPEVEKP